MSVRIEIYGEFTADALSEIRTLAAALVAQSHPVSDPAPSVAPSENAEPKESRRGRGRPRKDDAVKTAEEEAAPAATEVAAVDTPEVSAQDAADEAAETAATAVAEVPVTMDDLRKQMQAYVMSYGMVAAQEDGKMIFAEVLGAPPDGEPMWKMSLVASAGLSADKLGALVGAWQMAVAQNPYGRTKPAAKA